MWGSRKPIPENDKARRLTSQVEDKGQWELHKHLKKDAANPLIAVRRRRKGPKEQQPGTIATSPEEIDTIIMEVSGNIYKGNLGKWEGQNGSRQIHKAI